MRTLKEITDGFRRVGRRVDRFDIAGLARWWTQATEEARFELLQRIIGQKAPQKGDPTIAELRLAIVLAEAEAGEVIHETGPTR